MARHNREGTGTDQHGVEHVVAYQPDWLRRVKVARALSSGRQSTKTLFSNPQRRAEAHPGERVRTRIAAPSEDVDFEIQVEDPNHRVVQVKVTCLVDGEDGPEEVEYLIDARLPGPRG